MEQQQNATTDPVLTAFRPLHKLALGVGVGAAASLVIFAITALHLIRQPAAGLPLDLLAQYFRGYSVSWVGALIGAAWAGFVGFCFGWFFAFGRNFIIAVELVVIRTRAEMAQTRDFLDHI